MHLSGGLAHIYPYMHQETSVFVTQVFFAFYYSESPNPLPQSLLQTNKWKSKREKKSWIRFHKRYLLQQNQFLQNMFPKHTIDLLHIIKLLSMTSILFYRSILSSTD